MTDDISFTEHLKNPNKWQESPTHLESKEDEETVEYQDMNMLVVTKVARSSRAAPVFCLWHVRGTDTETGASRNLSDDDIVRPSRESGKL